MSSDFPPLVLVASPLAMSLSAAWLFAWRANILCLSTSPVQRRGEAGLMPNPLHFLILKYTPHWCAPLSKNSAFSVLFVLPRGWWKRLLLEWCISSPDFSAVSAVSQMFSNSIPMLYIENSPQVTGLQKLRPGLLMCMHSFNRKESLLTVGRWFFSFFEGGREKGGKHTEQSGDSSDTKAVSNTSRLL